MTAVVSDTEFGFTYAGAHSRDFNLKVIDIRRNLTPDISEQIQNVPGATGDLYQGTDVQSRIIAVDVKIIADSHSQRVELADDISQWLAPIGDAEFALIFDDDQAFTYYAHVQSTGAITRALYNGTATITFACSDPRGYGEQLSIEADTNPKTVTPDGASEIFPIFTCIPGQDVTKIAVTDQDRNYAYIGQEIDPETGDSGVDKEPRVVHDTCNTLATWATLSTTPPFNLENAVVSSEASMQSTPDSLMIGKDGSGYADFGPPVAGKYHGAGLLQYFPATYADYRIRIRLFNTQHDPAAKSKIEVYLLNAQGDRIGRIYLKDNGAGSAVWLLTELGGASSGDDHHALYYGQGHVKSGRSYTKTVKVKNGTVKVKSKGKTITEQRYKTITLSEDLDTDTFTDFYGYIEIQKIGNKFRCEIQKLDSNANPLPGWLPMVRTYTDKQGKFADALAGVALYVGKYDIPADTSTPVYHYENNHMGLCDVVVHNIIDGGNDATKPDIIARAGDEIKINCEDGHVYKNGARFMSKLQIGSNFPKMQGGVPNTYGFDPAPGDAEWTIDYRPTKG